MRPSTPWHSGGGHRSQVAHQQENAELAKWWHGRTLFRACVLLWFTGMLVAWSAAGETTPKLGTTGLASKLRPSLEFRWIRHGKQNHKASLEDTPPTPNNQSGDEVRVHRYAAVSLTQQGDTLSISFAAPDKAARCATRLNYKLEGYDAEWRDLERASVHLVLKFFDVNKTPVSRNEILVSGNAVGWSGKLATSTLATHIGEVIVPPRAAWLDVWIDSGGHDETTGVWLVDDLKIWESNPADAVRRLLLDEDFEQGTGLDQQQGDFFRWVRDGGALEGALVWSGRPARGEHALLIMDSNPNDYTAWHLKDRNLLAVVPGRQLNLQWSEVFSLGRGRAGFALYPILPSGQYQFRLREVNALGVPTGEEAVMPLIIDPPFHANLWFRAALLLSILALALVIERMAARRRMLRELEQFKRAQAVEQERARIARDIHDELGTILSRISMISEAAVLDAEPGSRQVQRLGEICETSRQLTRTMEEIVWAQDPKHDSLENMVSYFCSFASDLLAVAGIACRLDIPMDLPDLPMDAEQRHELFLVFKEALNNIIKHAAASEVRISLKWQQQAILLTIEDNGRGFSPTDIPQAKGNGLKNMQNRLRRVNGWVEVHSALGQGTRIEISMPNLPAGTTPSP